MISSSLHGSISWNISHVFEGFKEFRALDEKQCSWPIKCLRSDNGGEHVSRQFEVYYSRMAFIDSDLSLTPLNRMQWQRERIWLWSKCLLQTKDLPTNFWSKAIYCSNYLLTLVPTRVVNDMTSVEKWQRGNHFFGHLKAIWCVSWVHINDICIINWIQRVMLASWWDILMNQNPIDYLTLLNNILSWSGMWYLMRIFQVLSY